MVSVADGRRPTFHILLIDGNQATSAAIMKALDASTCAQFNVRSSQRLCEGMLCLEKESFVAVLVNLFLEDSLGIETYKTLQAAAPAVPVLIITDDEQEALAVEAVESGAQDYLFPSKLDSYSLPRMLRNIIEREAVEASLYNERERALVTLNSIGDAVLCTGISGQVTYLNPRAERLTGCSREEAVGKLIGEVFRILDGTTREVLQDPTVTAMAENRTVRLRSTCILISRSGQEFSVEDSTAPIHDRRGAITGAVIVFHDVSATRAMALEMTHAAHHDAVTGLPNRLLFDDRISQAIAVSHRTSGSFAVMFLDLDRFKGVNDSLGHAMGDKLLQAVSKRLVETLRETDTISRHGGDEFVILLPDVVETRGAETNARRLLVAISEPYVIGDQTLHINGSIGISFYPEDGADAGTIIHNADLAMYQAKEGGRNTFRFFEERMNLQALERQQVESGIRRALERNEFILHYQPKVNLVNGTITGAEALIRWQNPTQGLIAPEQFVPVAEASGLIVPIGRWVLREACKQTKTWQDQGLSSLSIAVNVSAVEFHQENFLDGVESTLAETGLAPDYLQLELTESVLMKDAASTTLLLENLKALGVKLVIDDFGTGYSSLSYLRKFPIDVLKIDKSFIHNITDDPESSVFISAIIAIGRSLKHVIVAEGIETREQKDYLLAANCSEGQGFYFSDPLAPADFARFVQE